MPDMDVPDFIRSNVPGSFALFTINNRLPKILRDILANNDLGGREELVISLLENLKHLKITALGDGEAHFTLFNDSIRDFLGNTIYDAPFFVAEIFFYQLIAERTGYYNHRQDYFAHEKQTSLKKAVDNFYNRGALLEKSEPVNNTLEEAIRFSLTGNVADLSLFNLNMLAEKTGLSTENILIDHTRQFIDFLSGYKGKIHVFLDNAGEELISDLLLIDKLLINTTCDIQVHVKPIPMFVSDVTMSDWHDTLDALCESSLMLLKNLGKRLRLAELDTRLAATTNDFWASTYFFTDSWLNKIGVQSGELIISKGDLNYRRFFQDRKWPPTTPSAEATEIKDNKLLLIRVLKSEIITGLSQHVVNELNTMEKDWMVSARFGLIQLL